MHAADLGSTPATHMVPYSIVTGRKTQAQVRCGPQTKPTKIMSRKFSETLSQGP